ncbi:hypothetical protein DOE51_01370 [Bdellovibrio sp. NC01]|nr:hypothetical protein DOE51_01370 [Bdellovibrio sp. NC01]
MNKLKLLIAAGFLFCAAPSHAVGLFLEPGIFYEKGDHETTWPSPFSSSTGSTHGGGIDLKLGVSFGSVFYLAADGMWSKVKFEDSSNDYSANATSNAYAGILGFQFPVVGLRAWGGYVFNATLDPDQDGTYDVKFDEGKGWKAGIGFKIFIVSLNVEYMQIKYDKSKLEAPVATDFDEKMENKVGMISVSFPMNFGD